MMTPMNSALTMEPASMAEKSPAFPLILSFKRQVQMTSRALPVIMQGRTAGIADTMGVPEIKNAVTGVITERMIPHRRPPLNPARIIQALITGPVINTLVFLKN